MPDLSAPASNRCWVAWSLFTAAGRFDQNACMTAPITHLWRLLKWGRILARHGALTGIEKDPLTPLPVRRLARLARFGARRSEEHTSELQSLMRISYAVFCLKKTTQHNNHKQHI